MLKWLWMEPLIDHAELSRRLGEVMVFDIRWSLTDPRHGQSSYASGHIPGAVFVDLDRDLSSPPGLRGRHPLPEPDDFVNTLGRLGIARDSEVVVYDDVRGTVAARMWWMLRSIGHMRSRLLDGGFHSWVGAGHPLERGASVNEPVTYPPIDGFRWVATRQKLRGRPLVDARAAERYRGENEPVDPKPGHIPGAVNVPAAENLARQGTFLSERDLRAVYRNVGSEPVVYCGSGVTACHDALAIFLASGRMPQVYVGSYSEWTRLGMPVATGPQP